MLNESLTWTDHTNMVVNKNFVCNMCIAPIKEYFSEGNITNIIQHTNITIPKL